MIKKYFLFLMPVVIIFMMIIQLFSEEKNITKKSKNSVGVNRQTASVDITNGLTFFFRKKTLTKKLEENGDYVSKEEKKANEDLNYLRTRYFFANKNIDQSSFQKQNNDIQNRIRQNPKLYNDMLSFAMEDSLLANENKVSTQLFALAASLPLGPSSMQNASEKILIDLISMDREWDEELFKNALQFYYIQNLVKNEKNDTLIANFIERCPDEEIKLKIIQIDKEINIYSKNDEHY